VREAALLVRELLDALGLPAFVKTTGGKGLHAVVPLQRRHAWDEVKGFARAIAEHLATVFPDRFTANMAKARRGGRIFVDYLRNAEGATAVAAFSVRAREGAPVSLPVAWEALDDDIRGARFNLRNVAAHVLGTPDPWADYAQRAARITAAMRRKLAA
jgi:bifunctional non-homologous end joining protein LigD